MRWDGRVEAKDDAGKAVVLLSISALGRDPRKADPAFERMTMRVWQVYGLGHPQVHGGVMGHFVRIGTSLWARRYGPQIATAMLAVGVCPSCAYSLAGLESQDERLLVCPECGASWNSLKITNPRRFRDVPSRGKAHRGLLGKSDKPCQSVLDDDRGWSVPLVSGQLRAEIATAEDDEHRRKLVEMRREIAPTGRRRRRSIGGSLVVFGILGGLLAAWLMLSTRPAMLPGVSRSFVGSLVVIGIFPLLVFGSVWLKLLRGNWCSNPSHVRRVMLARALCPSCSAELVARDVGLSVCQDCGAAWELPGRLVERGEVR